MSFADFVSDYTGTLDDKTRQLLLANGATSGAIPDLWMQFFTALGFTTGTIDDRTRAFLVDYVNSGLDSGETIDDLWGQVSGPYVP